MDKITKKSELRKYLESESKDKSIEYCIEWLKDRKIEKKIEYQLSEFECKSLCFPSVSYIQKKFGSEIYKDITEKAGLMQRYVYDKNIVFNDKELEIICDTREQNILSFKNIQIAKLDYGDYYSNNDNAISIERKSLVDLVGTISQGYARFKKEIDRCRLDNNYLIVVIEEKYNNLLSFSYLPHMKMVRAKETFILHRIRDLIQSNPMNLQFLCVDGRKESVRVIEKIFNIKDNIRTIDLQWAYNNKIL